MADTVGSIGLDLELNNSNYKKELARVQKYTNDATSKISNSFSKIGAAVAAAFSVALIKKFGQESIENAAAVNAANSQMEQTFGNLEDSARAAMKAVADESGILETRLQGVGTSIYAFAKASGMDSVSALDMMKEALQVTADSAAYYDRSLEDTAESLKSFLKGNYANDAALGISCTETTRNTAANKLYGKSFKDLSEAQKQLVLLQMVKDANQLSGAVGQAARESEGWENVIGNLKESWRQFTAVIGQPILQAATVVVKNITNALATLTQYAKSASSALSELFGKNFGDGAAQAASSVAAASSSAGNLSESTEDASDNLKESNKQAKKLKQNLAGFDKLNVLSNDSDSSDTSSTSAVSATADLKLPDTKAISDDISNSFKKGFKDLYKKSGAANFVSKVQKGVESVNWSAIKTNCSSIFKSLKPIASTAFKGIQKVGKSALGAVGSYVGGVVSVTGKSLQTVTGGIAKWLKKDGKKIKKFIDTASSNFSTGFDNLSEYFDTVFGTLGTSIDEMRTTMGNAIASMLGGFTDFGIAIGTITSNAFRIATDNMKTWAKDNQVTMLTTFNNIQGMMADLMNGVGTVFGDIGKILSDWWNGKGGAEIFDNICKMFLNVGTTLMNVYNEWIKPAWDFVCGVFSSAWNDAIKPIFEKLLSFFGKVCEAVSTIWNNFLSPLVNWIVKALSPHIVTAFNTVKGIFQTVFKTIGDVIGGIIDALGGLMDFITGGFSGNWEKAWDGIKTYYEGVWNSIWGIIKGVINLIVDGINILWSGIYKAVKGIVDSIGGVAGALGDLFGQDWHFSMPEKPPLIPKLAKGGLVKAPTLALVGDNKNARNDPEVISPLSKLKGMIDSESSGGDSQVVVMLSKILRMLEKIYSCVNDISVNDNGKDIVIVIDGEEVFRVVRKKNNQYKKRHGKSALV